ncbi:hypothetical protein PQX77_016635 [Marasmius sp. AFHP31]|nr:hypothetical protein PQX77_016635 [Marasmius sp. AFHP31]
MPHVRGFSNSVKTIRAARLDAVNHVFSVCPRFNRHREHGLGSLQTQLPYFYDRPEYLSSIGEREHSVFNITNHLFHDDAVWPLTSTRHYLGIPPTPHIENSWARVAIANAMHAGWIRMAGWIWGDY